MQETTYGLYDDGGRWIANVEESNLPQIGETFNGREIAYVADSMEQA